MLVVLVAFAGVAAAQPVSFQIKSDVAVGQKPQIRLTAVERVSDVRVELDRSDGKHVSLRPGALAKGQSVTLNIGDGAPGRASYKGTVSAQVPGESGRWSDAISFDTAVHAPLKVAYDADHLDLDKRVLQFKPARAVTEATLVVTGEDGKELGKGSATYKDKELPADGWLSITWTQPAGARVLVMRLRVAASDGTATNIELVPWSVAIDHEDVNFATDSAVIEPSENAKLDASLAKITDVINRAQRFMELKLYVAGHTDTVGSNAKNRKLSLDRALAIASYFRKKGVNIPIVVAGFGEEVLKVATPDNKDERANRRADYVIGPAAGAPPFKGPYLKVRADWKQLR